MSRSRPLFLILMAAQDAFHEQFATAVLPFIWPVVESQQSQRVRRLAFELHRRQVEHENVVALVNFMDWPWVREAYLERLDYPSHETYFAPLHRFAVRAETPPLFLGSCPISPRCTSTRERRSTPTRTSRLTASRNCCYVREIAGRRNGKGRQLGSPRKLLQLYLQYVRNLTLIDRRLSPDLYTLVTAAKQIGEIVLPSAFWKPLAIIPSSMNPFTMTP